ncbi:MAG: hypothetical protein AAF152_09495 [Cyanobacteria bacterium P01_A01_bin.114]
MTFNIRLLDNLSYDDVEPLLDEYIEDAIDQFVASETGQAYVKNHPDGGGWIGTFIEMAYLYGEMTLPKMTKGDVQQVMEYILPRKLTLLDPSETDDAIPELVAFWTFLKQAYRLRSAGAIAKYLLSIQAKFRDWMFDPGRGGIAKNFMLQGIQAGYDMTTEEGMKAFQAEYNQNIRANPPARPPLQPLSPKYPMVAPPPEVQQMLDQLGVELPEVGEMVNPAELMGSILKAAKQALPNQTGTNSSPELDQEFAPPLQATMMGERVEDVPTLSEEASALLQAQTITETEPGSILQDFQTLLDLIGSKGIAISGKRHQISLKLLTEINQRLSKPTELDLKRPQQKSYPPIHGLYLLLRATGIVNVVAQGKQHQLVLNPTIHDAWQQFNPTERYCTLLEAWLVRGHAEMLGDDRSGAFTEGDRCIQTWANIAKKTKHTYSKYTDQDHLVYRPGLHNIALMEMFGLLKLTAGKPEAGKGFRLKSMEALPWGKALMALITQAYLTNNLSWASETDPAIPFNELQPFLQPYFPEWQKSLTLPSQPFRPGRYIFKVSLGEIWRRLAISGEATLSHLSGLILDSVDFDSDHLFMFNYTNEVGRKVEAMCPYSDGELFTSEVQIGSLPLAEGGEMEYIFDFGDWWKFEVKLETVEPEPEPEPEKGFAKKTKAKKRRPKSGKSLGEIIEVHGEAPPQYPDYDEEW